MNLVDLLAEASRDGVQIHIWPTGRGYQANVKRKTDEGWTVYTDRDAVVALREALKQRVLKGAPPTAPAAAPGFEDLFG